MVLGLEIQLQEGSPTFDRWVGIIAIKTEGTQIQFLSNVLVAVRRWILKSLIDDQRVPSNDPRNNCGPCFCCPSRFQKWRIRMVFRAVTVRGVNTVHTVSAVHAVLASPVVSFCSHSCLFISSPTSLNINNFSFISWGQR